MHIESGAPLYHHIHSSAPFGRRLDPVARRGPPMYESVLRARSSNQRSHRSPRHAVARALTHQASPASIRAQGFSLLTGSRRSRHGTLSHKATLSSSSCAVATKAPFSTGSFESRRSCWCRLSRSHKVGKNGTCSIRTTALVCATASRHLGTLIHGRDRKSGRTLGESKAGHRR